MNMKLQKHLSAVLVFVFAMCLWAQAAEKGRIQGTVADRQGEPVVGASILVKGTTKGVSTDLYGRFTLEASPGNTLQVSCIGYVTQNVPVTSKTSYAIVLEETSQVMDEIVVTALGLKRSQKALGYAVQEVKSDKLTVAKGADVATSLTGKIAGLSVKNSTEFAAGPSLALRGESPLLVVDGIPHYNTDLNDIPADDIESISVLKGAAASALYGSRGRNGAVMITTKRAKNEGLEVTVNSGTMFQAGFLKLPEVQTSYSSGGAGRYGTGDYVWGDKLDIGRTAVQYNPSTYEWEEMPLVSKGKDNLKHFLEPSFVTNNNVSVEQKGQYGGVRTSINHIYNKGQYPNTAQNRLSFTVAGTMDYKRFHLNANLTYNKRMFTNDNGTGYGQGGYIYNLLLWSGSEFDLRDYRNYWVAGKEHIEQNWMDASWYNNPYFLAYEKTHQYDQDLTNGSLDMTLDLTSWLKFKLRLGGDSYNGRYESRAAKSTRGSSESLKGYYSESLNTGFSTADDAMILADKKLGEFNLDGFVGGSIYYRENRSLSATTKNGLSIPGYYSLKASVDPVGVTPSTSKEQVNSIYGKFGASWRSTLFFEATGRNDWASTLSQKERSYFYPAFSGSVALNELLPLPQCMNFWKVRGSWTKTKRPASVYDINSVYSISTNYWGNATGAFYPSAIRDASLRPASSRSYEIGTEIYMFNSRLRFDVAYYNKRLYDLQRYVALSNASGSSSTLVNYGEEQLSRGWEFTVSGDVITTPDFNWNSSFNWAADRYLYAKVDEKYSTQRPWVAPGKTWWWLDMYDWERTPDGQLILYNGMPRTSAYPKYAGDSNPDWIWGWSNSLRYKDFALNFSLDGRVGGVMFDYMSARMWHSGAHIDSDNAWRYDEVVNGNHKGYVAEGVKVVSGSVSYDSDGNITEDTRVFAPNDVAVSYESWCRAYGNSDTKSHFLKSKTFIKLRELSLTYRLPRKWCVGPVKGAEAGLVGQNLLIWTRGFRFSDPDVDTENINSPSTRLLGFNVKLNF